MHDVTVNDAHREKLLSCSVVFHIFTRSIKFYAFHYQVLGDSWNYIPPILVSSSAKRIATQILVIAKLNEREDFILRGFVYDIISPYKELPIQSCNWSTRINGENCSRLRMKTLGRCQWRRSNVDIVNCKHFSNILLIIDFELANVFWAHIEKLNTFEDKIRYIMCYVVVISVWPKLINK